VDYFHGCPQRCYKLVFAPLEIGTKNLKMLENLKSAPRFRFIELILATTLYRYDTHTAQKPLHCSGVTQ